MKMTIQELKNSIASILLENGVDFTIDNAIADQELGIVALFKLRNIDVNIYVSLRADVWVISRLLSDRKEIIYFRKLESFLQFIRDEAVRSCERKAQCDISSTSNILEGERIKSEINLEAMIPKQEDAPFQYSQKEAVNKITEILRNHKITYSLSPDTTGENIIQFRHKYSNFTLVVDQVVISNTRVHGMRLYLKGSQCPEIACDSYTTPRNLHIFCKRLDKFLKSLDGESTDTREKRLEPDEESMLETAESDKDSSVCGKFANEESKNEYRPDQLLGKTEKKEDSTFHHPAEAVEKVLNDRKIEYTTEDCSSSFLIKIPGPKAALRMSFKLRPDLTNEVYVEQIRTENSEVYMTSKIFVRDRTSLEYLLCSLDTLLTEQFQNYVRCDTKKE